MRFFHPINRKLTFALQSTRNNTALKWSKFGTIFSQKRDLSSLHGKFKEDDSILPVLIVGAGPVGLVLSLLLTKLGKSLLNPSLFFIY